MLRKYLFVTGYSLKNIHFMKCYDFVKRNEFATYEHLKRYQEGMLRKLIWHSYYNLPYYHELFRCLKLKPEDIKSVEDLQKLPILTKEIIRSNREAFIPINLNDQKYINRSTGGSTGHPFQYRLSNTDEILGLAIMYANRGYAGYKLGDKIGLIAGSSLIPSTKSNLVADIKAFILNERRFSSFDLSDNYMKNIVVNLNKSKPKYLRGYASSIYIFAKYINDADLAVHFYPRAIFTTAEVLSDRQREIIEDVFNCPVFNQYGLNDGGVSAYECEVHAGLHIDMIRSIMEIADSNGSQLESGEEGHILATGLHNYAMPFIRYDTGDMGVLSGEKCRCGREFPLMEKLVGRVSDFIYTPEGMKIHGEFFTHIFWEFDWVKQFQIVQTRLDEVTIKIVPDDMDEINKDDLDRMKDIVLNRTGSMDIAFEIVDKIETTKAGKWKFVIREV